MERKRKRGEKEGRRVDRRLRKEGEKKKVRFEEKSDLGIDKRKIYRERGFVCDEGRLNREGENTALKI